MEFQIGDIVKSPFGKIMINLDGKNYRTIYCDYDISVVGNVSHIYRINMEAYELLSTRWDIGVL